MTELLTAAQMRAIEAAAIASGEVTGLELMERAGRGVVEAIFEEWPELAGVSGGAAPTPPGYLGQDESTRRAVVLCGPGNNGGDGFVVARLLKERGWEVEVFLYGEPERLPPDARVNYETWRGIGEVCPFHQRFVQYCFQADLLVDALFGTGLTRPVDGLPGVFDSIREACNNLFCGPSHPNVDRVVSVDIASGHCADSGRWMGPGDEFELCPDLTVTFHRPKIGHYLCNPFGKLVVVDIGLQHPAEKCSRLLGWLDRERVTKKAGHKYDYGHVLILAGSSGHGGAARLAARGALRIGAGLVTVGCPTEAIPENAARLDAVMLKPVADAAGLAAVLEDRRINALCLGPGMGTGEREAGLLAAALKLGAESATSRGAGGAGPASGAARRVDGRSLILDADALTLLAGRPELFAALHPRCVLTPHAGEFGRLFPDIAAKLEAPATKGPAYSKVDATREAAARAGCVVLFKGPDTVIADPSGRCSINSAHYDRAAPWLATAGSGDVLSGFIAGLLARGFEPMAAAETAAWLHVECARSFGPGLIAEDLPEELPKVFRALGV